MEDNGFELSEEYFEYSLREGAYIIFFDGYDEVNRDKTEKITSEIKALSEKYGGNKFLFHQDLLKNLLDGIIFVR